MVLIPPLEVSGEMPLIMNLTDEFAVGHNHRTVQSDRLVVRTVPTWIPNPLKANSARYDKSLAARKTTGKARFTIRAKTGLQTID